MKAAVRVIYGAPNEVLRIQQIDKPTPKDDDVLIKVYAASVNRSDYHVLTGKPFFMRLLTGLSKPRIIVVGSDFAGRVEAAGSAVTAFKAGDKVMGFAGALGYGTLAEYITFPESKGIVLMPGNITYEQAAGCLEGTFYAAGGLSELKPTAGQKALVYGATGAIGSAHVQLLKYYGVYVTAVCGGEHADIVRSLGADKVIDYKTRDFTKDDEQYDYVIDAIGKSTFAKCKPLLKKKGKYLPSNGLENIFLVPVTRLLGGKRVLFNAPKDIRGNLGFIKRLVEEDRFHPLIDRTYPLEKVAEAFTYVGTGQKIGNVIIKMDD